MKPVVTVAEMRRVDERAMASGGLEGLIARAGYATAMVASEMCGGLYGREVVVVAGRGHNGDDGRAAAAVLSSRGARVRVFGMDAPRVLPDADLVIDAAFGTGFHGEYRAPAVPARAQTLAVDIPSGLDGTTGLACEGAVRADVTVTFGAPKPGHLFGDGPSHAGRVVVDDIGLDVGDTESSLVEEADLAELPARRADAHKWSRAVYVFAGSTGMVGAARLCARGALRAGVGMVRLGAPGVPAEEFGVTEAVSASLPADGNLDAVRADLARCRALVVGPGIGRSDVAQRAVRDLLAETTSVPIVVDADALNAIAGELPHFVDHAGVVLTPHDGEFARLAGHPVGVDRIGAARELATRSGAVVLLKGPTTVVADPAGPVRIVAAGTTALATAGTGDVLSGVVGALLARGLAPIVAASLAAQVHGMAGRAGLGDSLVASDLPELIARVLDSSPRAPGRAGARWWLR